MATTEFELDTRQEPPEVLVAFFGNSMKNDFRNIGSCMRTIAERLVTRPAASTPMVFTGVEFDFHGLAICHSCFRHCSSCKPVVLCRETDRTSAISVFVWVSASSGRTLCFRLRIYAASSYRFLRHRETGHNLS